MQLEEIKEFLRKHPGYSKEGSSRLSRKLNANESLCYQALGEIRKEFKNKHNKGILYQMKNNKIHKTSSDIFKNAFTEFTNDILNGKIIKPNKLKSSKNVLVIGDLHLPFTLDGYLEHCIKTYYKYKCDTVVFIGDILDLHFTSYH